MLGRFITFAVIVVAGSVGLVGFADRPSVGAPAAKPANQGNFTTQKRGQSSKAMFGSDAGQMDKPMLIDSISGSSFTIPIAKP